MSAVHSNIIGSSGQLLIQCGGYGNLQEIIAILERIARLDQFKEHFADWKQPVVTLFTKLFNTYIIIG